MRLRSAAAIGLKRALRHEILTPEIFGNGGVRAAFDFTAGSGAQPFSSAAQLLRTRIFAASYEYIASRLRPQKSRAPRVFHHCLCNFSGIEIFSPRARALTSRLCYYRQRSLKIFFDACGSRKKLDRSFDA
jgi:hypothetical protein